MQARAGKLLTKFKGNSYTYGVGVLDAVANYGTEFGERVLVVANKSHLKPCLDIILCSLGKKGLEPINADVVAGARTNTPIDDVYRIAKHITDEKPDCIVAVGGGSTIDAVKAATVLAVFGGEIEDYFGTGLVNLASTKRKRELCPIIAVPTTAGSGAHLTKYANVTDIGLRQKKLIVDELIVPSRAVFDYSITQTVPQDVTIDGVLDGISHIIEVFYGISDYQYALSKEITTVGLELFLKYTPQVLADPNDIEARTALGLASDLGGYAIMIGGTNGPHLNSFSLVDITSHGRACGILTPYYTVFFSPAIEKQLRVLQQIYARHGLIHEIADLSSRDLGISIAEGMLTFMKRIGCPTSLGEISGFSLEHREKMLDAAKHPQLDMKLRNMPIPFQTDMIDTYMKSVLEAAVVGDVSLVKNMSTKL